MLGDERVDVRDRVSFLEDVETAVVLVLELEGEAVQRFVEGVEVGLRAALIHVALAMASEVVWRVVDERHLALKAGGEARVEAEGVGNPDESAHGESELNNAT